MHKKGFSMAEILITLVIMGVISVACLITIKPDDKVYGKLYYRAYYALSTAAYNVQMDCADTNRIATEEAQANGNPEPSGDDLMKFPANSTELCKKLASDNEGYINISGSLGCFSYIDATDTTQFSGKTGAWLRSMANFTASNGMMYFFSPTVEEDGATKGSTIVWVDLNGERAPNTAEWTAQKMADIVPFRISKVGTVQPLGVPTYDIRYLTARIVYADPDYAGPRKLTSYRAAYFGAFGGNVFPFEPISMEDPIVIPTSAQRLITAGSFDSNCSVANTSGYPGCSIDVEPNE